MVYPCSRPLELGVPYEPRIDQFAYCPFERTGCAQHLQMPLMMQVGTKKIYILFFDKIKGQLPDFGAIVTYKGKQIQLEQTAAFAELVIPAFIAGEIEIALRMREDRLIALELLVEEDLFEIDGGHDEGKLHEEQVVFKGKEGGGLDRIVLKRKECRSAGKVVRKPIVDEVFRGGAKFHREALPPDLRDDAVAPVQDDFRCIPEVVAVDMRRRYELSIAQVDQPADQQQRSLQVRRAVVDPRDQVGMYVTAKTFQTCAIPGLLSKK